MGLLGPVVSQAEVGVTDKTEFRLRIEMGGTEEGESGAAGTCCISGRGGCN